MKKSKVRKIIKEEVNRFLVKESGMANGSSARPKLKEAIREMEDQSELIQNLVYIISSKTDNQFDLTKIIKLHSAYLKALKELESNL